MIDWCLTSDCCLFLFLKCAFSVSFLCPTVVWKSTHTMSAQCEDGGKEGREVIDMASAPMPWHSRWDGWRGGRGRMRIMLHLQPHANLVNPELHLFPFSCLFLSFNLSNCPCHFFYPHTVLYMSPVFLLISVWTHFFPTPFFLSSLLFTSALLCFTSLLYLHLSFLAGPAVLLSNLTSPRMGRLLQWSCLLLAFNVEREKKTQLREVEKWQTEGECIYTAHYVRRFSLAALLMV